MLRCAICEHDSLELVESFGLLPRIGSDSTPFPAGGKLGQCSQCGTVQKPMDHAFKEDCDAIYSSYAMYTQSAEGSEPKVFDGALDGRSVHLAKSFCHTLSLPSTGRLLDFGCGNGSLLRAFAAERPGWTLAGIEQDDRNKEVVESIPGCERLYTGDLTAAPNDFDIISLVHALEHVHSPVEFLMELQGHMTPDGAMVIHLPLWTRNPFDLVVADHGLHCDATCIAETLNRAGLHMTFISEDVVARELTVIATRKTTEKTPSISAPSPTLQQVLAWLEQTQETCREARMNATSFGIFGTGNAAVWLTQCVDAVDFYVDEDPSRVGTFRETDTPVFTPEQVPDNATVAICLPPTISRQVYDRVKQHPVNWLVTQPIS